MVETTGEIRKHAHPGRGRGRGAPHPKGRQLDVEALAEVQSLLGERPRRRDLLIEHLHLIQERFGHLSAAHLAALAHEMGLAMTEVYEVATFYAHFDVVKEDEAPPPPLTIRVCDSLTCELLGAQQLLAALQSPSGLDPRQVRVVRAPCMGHCDTAPVAEVGHHYVDHATAEKVAEAVRAGHTHAEVPAVVDYDRYVADGGYRLLRRYQGVDATTDQADRAILDLLGALNEGGLRGLGGAGFPTGRKWEFVRKEPTAPLSRGQRRRGRARHLQGPLLPRARPAPLPRGRADRGLGDRGRGGLHLSARRVPRHPRRYCCARSRGSRRRGWQRRATWCCAAAPAPTSAARNPRCSRASRASAACRATGRPMPPRSACSAGRP